MIANYQVDLVNGQAITHLFFAKKSSAVRVFNKLLKAQADGLKNNRRIVVKTDLGQVAMFDMGSYSGHISSITLSDRTVFMAMEEEHKK